MLKGVAYSQRRRGHAIYGRVTKDDTTLLEGIFTRMTTPLCNRATRMPSERKQTKMTHIKTADSLRLLGFPRMTAMLRQKRLRWIGHALR